MSAHILPFDDIRKLIKLMPAADEASAGIVRQRDGDLTKPPGSLGRLEEIAQWLAAWQGKARPSCEQPEVAVFAANHGVTTQGVSPFPSSVTQAMVQNFRNGGAAINQICATFGAGLKVFELALEHPTPDISEADAFDEAGCAATVAFGMEAIAGGADLLCLGEMGIGNTTVAAAIYHALYGGKAADWTGRGTGLDDAGLARKSAVVARAVARCEGVSDPLEVLRRLGGREVAACVGAILAARMERIPVVLDGYVVTAAAAIVHAIDPSTLDHCIAGHVSAEGAHGEVLRRIGKKPLLDLSMRLGEGSGAGVAIGLIKCAVACHNGMATFAQAGVAGKEA